MYYDLIASLPHLPYFTRADRLPITERELQRRLLRLTTDHAWQLEQVQPLVEWRPARTASLPDADFVRRFSQLTTQRVDPHLLIYVLYRVELLALLWGLRHKLAGSPQPDACDIWTLSPLTRWMQRHWEKQDFGLARAYPWLPRAASLMAQADARGLEQLLIDLCWKRLCQCSGQNYFQFAEVFSYVFRWDMLRAWLACDATQAKVRFTELVGEVTGGE